MTFARIRALIFVALLFVAGGTVVVLAVVRDSQTATAHGSKCPPGAVPAKIHMPEKNQVTVNVINGTKRIGLANQIADEFRFRGYNVHNTTTAAKVSDQIAEIAYGPEAVGAAWLVSANFLVDEAEMDFDINRKGAEVDVTLGTKFQQLATSTEVNQSIAAIGDPLLPPGTCEL
jgi:LytR cell envelope-related transcriptional attenuator